MLTTPTTDNDAILADLRETYDRYASKWREIYRQGTLDMECLSIMGPWPKSEREARADKDNPRPCDHFDIVSQQNNRVVNQVRMNKRAIKITPRGGGANDETAALREDRIRQIEYESKANRARLTAFQNAVDRGYGFYEIATDFISPSSMNQRIVYRRIPNPDSVLVDPDAQEADFSDMEGAFKVEVMPHVTFRRRFPEATIQSFTADMMNTARPWINEHSVMVANYWCVKRHPMKLYEFAGMEKPIMHDDLMKSYPGAKVMRGQLWVDGEPVARLIKERESERKKVVKYLTNGVEILETVDVLCSTIPIITMIGREKYVDGEREIESLTRKQRAPQLAFDVAATGELEVMGMTPKSKWVIIDGQVDGYEDEWKNSNRSPMAYLRYRAMLDSTGSALLPSPQRIDFEPPIQAFELAKDSAMRSVQNAVGMTSAERVDRVSKSGIAQKELNQLADIASYHFIDNYDCAVEYDGRIVNELLDKIEDSARQVGIRKEDDTYEVVDLEPTEGTEGQPGQHPYGDGDQHSVTISTGPSFESQREAAQETANNLISNPAAFPLVGWLAVKMLNLGVYGDKMSDLLKLLLPPEARQEDGQQQIPPEAMQALQQAKQQAAALDAMAKELQVKVIELEDEKNAKVLDLANKKEIAAMQDETKRFLEELKADIERAKIAADLQIAQLQSRTALQKTHEELTSKEEMAQYQTENQQREDQDGGSSGASGGTKASPGANTVFAE